MQQFLVGFIQLRRTDTISYRCMQVGGFDRVRSVPVPSDSGLPHLVLLVGTTTNVARQGILEPLSLTMLLLVFICVAQTAEGQGLRK